VSSPGDTMVSDRLFFGRNIPAGGTVSDSAWTAFLAEVVTPRFPNGLTILRSEGHWLDPRGTMVRESGMVLEIAHRADAESDSLIALVAEDYCKRFGQDAVLRITTPARVRFYTVPR
jgi:hypothetical protein